jgi:intracellular multiplication protein IcmC
MTADLWTVFLEKSMKNRWLFLLLIVGLMTLLTGCAQVDIAKKDLAQMIENLQSSIRGLWVFMVATSYIMGISFIMVAVFKLKKFGQARTMMDNNASITGPAVYLVVGVALIYLKDMANVVLATVWSNADVDSLVSWQGGGQVGLFNLSGAMQNLIRLVGLIAFIRGWVMLAKLGSESRQPGTLSKGLLHIFGGILGINIGGTLDLLHGTFFG